MLRRQLTTFHICGVLISPAKALILVFSEPSWTSVKISPPLDLCFHVASVRSDGFGFNFSPYSIIRRFWS